ncbi:hypothetical protein J9303_02665 [Bacillaceae bacterium Marseille-Q3522]|nr:hypothetical protein [Bacillaceae bacterium Marseille-Q3522]
MDKRKKHEKKTVNQQEFGLEFGDFNAGKFYETAFITKQKGKQDHCQEKEQ